MPVDKPKIGLNVDALEREGAAEPFWVTIAGKPYKLIDPVEVPWGVLIHISNRPQDLLEVAVGGDKRDDFLAAIEKLPAWKVEALAVRYRDHYGLPSSPEAGALST